jgi:peptidoglycan/xylan/chitin deacetylase (PgdA/CDA1 family)
MPTSFSRRSLLGGSLLAVAGAALGCSDSSARPGLASPAPATPRPSRTAARPSPAVHRSPHRPADAATVVRRATVPVLCWHQLRNWAPTDSAYDRGALVCPPAAFRQQLDALAARECSTIGPDQYLDHLTTGAPLPPRPVMLTFDDSQGSQISVALPELVRRRMTATFFVMTVVLDKPRWMRRPDLRRLDAAGMTVAAHTWDHSRADRYSGQDWHQQLAQPKAELERILRKPVRHFAYPYGAWSAADFPHLAQAGYATAYQLSGAPMDPGRPLYTLRRSLVHSSWTGPQLIDHLG